MMNNLSFTIDISGKNYHLVCVRMKCTHTRERFKVHPLKSEAVFIIVENNRPLIRGKYKLKSRPYDWKQIEGEVWSKRAFSDLIKVLQSWIEPKEEKKPSRDPARFHYSSTNDRKKNKPPGPALGERKRNE